MMLTLSFSVCSIVHLYDKIRAAWYVLMCALEDEDAQRNGIVNIYNSIGDAGSDPQVLEVLRHASLLDDGLPYRSNATHFCYDSAALRPLLQLLQLVAGKENRIRFRTHFVRSFVIAGGRRSCS